MEFIDEDSRPRFLFQSKPLQTSTTPSSSNSPNELQHLHQRPGKTLLFTTTTISLLLLLLSILYLQSEPFKSLLFWVSLSFLLGPLAPSSLTGGRVRVGHGPILEGGEEDEKHIDQQQPEKIQSETNNKTLRKRPNSKPVIRSDFEEATASLPILGGEKNRLGFGSGTMRSERNDSILRESDSGDVKEREWSEEDVEMLKKQLGKNPVGKPGRWEVIAAAFKGRHRVESVIRKAKELSERKLDGKNDDYAQFLKNRKPIDRRMESGNELVVETGDENMKDNGSGVGGGGGGWSSGEDLALLNALKAFPKDVAMRWEKIAATVPGKSKAACVKRVAELKKEFRSSKATVVDT